MNSPISDIELNSMEYMFTVGKHHYTDIVLKLSSPKLLPIINTSRPLTNKVVINKNIFVNETGNRPIPNSVIYINNYISVKRSVNCSLSSLADDDGFIPSGTRVTCSCLNGDIQQLTITDI